MSESLRTAYSARDRWCYLMLIAPAGAALVVARALTPSPNGFGTHQQLGLPPCPLLYLTGFPCPSCGLTTSFAHAARLHFYAAFVTQPFGLLAFLLTLAIIPLALYLIRRRVPWERVIHAPAANRVLYTLLALYLASWLYKIAVML